MAPFGLFFLPLLGPVLTFAFLVYSTRYQPKNQVPLGFLVITVFKQNFEEFITTSIALRITFNVTHNLIIVNELLFKH